jgi:hypothetical protein
VAISQKPVVEWKCRALVIEEDSTVVKNADEDLRETRIFFFVKNADEDLRETRIRSVTGSQWNGRLEGIARVSLRSHTLRFLSNAGHGWVRLRP